MITPNKEFFQWIYNRLVYVHNENPNVDYMISFKERIRELSFDEHHWKPSVEQMQALKYVTKNGKRVKVLHVHLLSNIMQLQNSTNNSKN